MSGAPPTIRLVREEDAPALRRMREEAGWDLEKVPGWISASLAGVRPTWVAELEGATVGMVALDFEDHDPEVANGSDIAVVTSVSVLASVARRGVGRALTLFAEAQARARGVQVLTLNTRPTNGAALALYEGLGYRRWKQQERPWGLAVFLRKTLTPG
ncbi:MAG TPA: GNAT family N-acetyltransferase [Myxococcaceae bacterium]|nr:GNAT family N-acetyltransferase [Myxococcaceae bacterium]